MASRTATPQPWAQANGNAGGGQALQLPQGAQAGKGKGPAGGARGASADPDGGASGAPESAKATNVDSLMDAVGASGVDLGAEEESLRATNDRMHAQAMHAAGSAAGAGGAPNPHAYAGIDRSRKQDFIDPGLLAECVKKVAAAFQLKTLEPDTIPLIALATRARLMSLVNASIAARDHRQQASHFRVPPLVAPQPARKRRRRNPLDGEVDEDLGAEDDDEDVEMDDADAGVKVPAWDTLVYDDPERLLGVMERVDREEERKKRRERLVRDERENEERQLAEALAASEAARLELEEQQAAEARKDAAEQAAEDGAGGGGKKKKADAKGKGKAKEAGGAPGTPAGKGGDSPALGKDGKPKKERKKKAKGEDGASGTSTPAPGSKGGAGAGGKNLSEDIKKRLTDQTALRSLGGQKFSWLNAGIGSPSPAGGGPGGLGTPGGLPKPKFAPASALPPPSFAPAGNGGVGTSTSMLNPANSGGGGRGGSGGDSAASAAATALTTSRLNIPPLHDAQRTQLAREQWAAGHRVVEAQDLLFALDRERGMGTGRGSGRSAAIRGRAGIMRGAYRGGMQGR
ncbi:hypothetical protein JCM10450v2_002906 [Rhodotorula kratochvilovae]